VVSAGGKKTPEQLLTELGITEPDDIDVEAIAAYCNAFVVYDALQGAEARIVGNGDKAFITINSASLPTRQRFSIGHELGHWTWDRGKIALSCSKEDQESRWTGADKETIANKFSADLLLPPFMFKPRARQSEGTLDAIKKLADQFRTSLTATILRYVEFGPFPCMVLMHSRAGLEWHRGSAGIDGRFWPCKQLDEYSFAYDLLKEGASASSSGVVDADTWINHPKAERYELVESSMLIGPDRVLSLLWWKNEKMITELLGGL
jgi:hypothetical protein